MIFVCDNCKKPLTKLKKKISFKYDFDYGVLITKVIYLDDKCKSCGVNIKKERIIYK